MKNFIITIGAIIFLILALWIGSAYFRTERPMSELPQNFKEVTFSISGTPVALKDGAATVKTNLGGADMTTVRYFGNELMHDVDGDEIKDVVFLITQETSAGNTFFYAVAALKRGDGYIGSHAVLIGDRIAPQNTNAGEGRMIIVNYAEREPGASTTVQPSVGKSLWLLLDPQTLEFGEVVQNFEGEAR